MVWKQHLAKLKQQLKEDDPPRPVQVPKPSPPVGLPKSMGEEDAMFLAAMGKRAPAPEAAQIPTRNGVKPEPPPPVADVDFQTAVGDLHGLKALSRNPLFSASTLPSKPALPEVVFKLTEPPKAEVFDVPVPAPVLFSPPPAPADSPSTRMPPGPRLIHLAAGMAVEVDGVLDLSGHAVNDAKERLKERLQDAGVLGWRTLHVILGPSEELRQAFLAFLLTPPARVLVQYAQAPISMGGGQAFIVYFAGPTA